MSSYVLNQSKMFADITDGIAIVINSETGIYYGMNMFGSAVFENLIKGVPQENIVAALKNLPDAPADMEEKVNTFVASLVGNELILKSDAPGANSSSALSFPQEMVSKDNFVPEVREYSDAQELLLADPIHEVKEETGWSPEKDALNPDAEDVARRERKMAGNE